MWGDSHQQTGSHSSFSYQTPFPLPKITLDYSEYLLQKYLTPKTYLKKCDECTQIRQNLYILCRSKEEYFKLRQQVPATWITVQLNSQLPKPQTHYTVSEQQVEANWTTKEYYQERSHLKEAKKSQVLVTKEEQDQALKEAILQEKFRVAYEALLDRAALGSTPRRRT